MLKLRFAVVAVAFGFSTGAFAQAASDEQRGACKSDYEKYCKGTMPGGGRVVACLNKQHDQLAAACKKVIDAQKK
jgi:hypothetical protein